MMGRGLSVLITEPGALAECADMSRGVESCDAAQTYAWKSGDHVLCSAEWQRVGQSSKQFEAA